MELIMFILLLPAYLLFLSAVPELLAWLLLGLLIAVVCPIVVLGGWALMVWDWLQGKEDTTLTRLADDLRGIDASRFRVTQEKGSIRIEVAEEDGGGGRRRETVKRLPTAEERESLDRDWRERCEAGEGCLLESWAYARGGSRPPLVLDVAVQVAVCAAIMLIGRWLIGCL